MAALSTEQELDALLNWNPPRLTLSSAASKSKASRGAGFYDKHLSDGLILKEVISLTSLLQDIAGVVDSTISGIQAKGIQLPPIRTDDLFFTKGRRQEIDDFKNQPMRNETSVANFYSNTTANYCVAVASTLALHPSAHKWASVLEWDQVPSKSGYAIADGVLRLTEKFRTALFPEQEEIDRMQGQVATERTQKLRDYVRDSQDDIRWIGLVEVAKRLGDIMTTVVKSLSVAPEGVMESIRDLFGCTFPWVKCESVGCGHHESTSGPHQSLPDAIDTPWTILPSTSEGTRKRKRDDKDDDNEDDSGDKDYVPVMGHHLTATKYLQLSWAQAVRNDSTLICMHAGSFEYIGVRHRATQRLYISDMINTHTCRNPAYGKLHIGAYIAAVNDAIDRALQLRAEDENDHQGPGEAPASGSSDFSHGGDVPGGADPKGGPQGGGRSSNTHPDKWKGGDGGSGKTTVRKQSASDSDYDRAGMVFQTKLHNMVLVYLQYGIYDSPVPATFLRNNTGAVLPHPSASPCDRDNRCPEEHMALILTSEIGEGATGIVHGATLKVMTSEPTNFSSDVVVKLSFLDEQRVRLRNEYANYRTLESKGVKGLSTVLGIFDDIEDGATILIMTHAGTPLHRDHVISSAQRSAFLDILREIHNAGILHCDLRLQNLLLNEVGEATIIDFDQSTRCRSKKEKKREYQQLIAILDTLPI